MVFAIVLYAKGHMAEGSRTALIRRSITKYPTVLYLDILWWGQLMFRLSTIRRRRRAQQRAPTPRTSSRSTSGRAGRASLETAGGCQCCLYTRTDRHHRVSVQQQQSRAVAAPAPGSIVGTSLLTDGGVPAIKWARIAPNFPRCGARLDGRNAPAAALPTEPRRLLRLNPPRARRLALPGRQLAHRASAPG